MRRVRLGDVVFDTTSVDELAPQVNWEDAGERLMKVARASQAQGVTVQITEASDPQGIGDDVVHYDGPSGGVGSTASFEADPLTGQWERWVDPFPNGFDVIYSISGDLLAIVRYQPGGFPPIGGGNFVPNPTFADGVAGYTVDVNNTIVADPTFGLFGTDCAKVTRITSGGDIVVASANVDVELSQFYSASASVRLGSLGPSVPRVVTIEVQWYDALDNLLLTDVSGDFIQPIDGSYLEVELAGIESPDTADYAKIVVTVAGAGVAEYHYFDGFQLEPGQVPTSYNANFGLSSIKGEVLAPATLTAREAGIGSARCFYGPAGSIGSVTGMVEGSLYVATDTFAMFFYDGAAWQQVTAASAPPASPGPMWDIPMSFDPRAIEQAAARTFTANNVYYFRMQGEGTCNGLAIRVGTVQAASSAQLAVYDNTGTGRNARPNNRKANSAITIATTTPAGYKTGTFAAAVVINHGDWVGFGVNNSSVAFASLAATIGMATNDITDGFACFQSGGGPTPPSTPGTLFGQQLTPVIVGI